jgi:KaiC/GvpD/RAD55 family RecA-like ATPase
LQKIKFDIEPLDFGAPEGILSNSTIVLFGPPGTGKSVITSHIAKNLMEKGKKVVYMNMDDSPGEILELFRNFRWKIDEYVEKGLFYLLDGFSYRLGKYKKKSPGVVREFTPENLENLVYNTVDTMDDLKIEGGLLIIDSLNELVSKLGVPQTIEYIKTIRALLSKLRNNLVIVVLHVTTDTLSQFELEMEYMVDGVIETRIEPNLQEMGIPLKQLLIKKMRGVPTNPLWIPYVITSEGVTPVDQQKLAALVKSRLKEAMAFKGQ